jgi:3-hydroxy-9,10-secoandrosta-1,3,5(10)-triene-9,17-dione monooxygenase
LVLIETAAIDDAITVPTTARTGITPPDAALTADAMVAAARALRPTLRDRQADTEAANRMLPEVDRACFDAGFYRVLQPRQYGGYEFDLATFARVMIELAAGCPSTGWGVAFTAGHIHVLGKYSEQAQTLAYGSTGDVRAPLVEARSTRRHCRSVAVSG